MAPDKKTRPRLKDIIRATCEVTHTTKEDLIREGKDHARERQIVAFLARENNYSYPVISSALRRHMTTVEYSVLAIAADIKNGRPRIGHVVRQVRARAHTLTANEVNQRQAIASDISHLFPPPPRLERPSTEQFSDHWWAENQRRFCEAMRKAHPELARPVESDGGRVAS
jgi:hypothetical protein